MVGKGIFRGRKSGPARRAVSRLVSHLPDFLRLLYRLLRDPRVSRLDKALVGATVAYVLTPIDLIPDFLSFLGLVDDLYLLGLVLDRLLVNAGPDLLREHWDGTPDALRLLLGGLDQLGALLPTTVRRVLGARTRTE